VLLALRELVAHVVVAELDARVDAGHLDREDDLPVLLLHREPVRRRSRGDVETGGAVGIESDLGLADHLDLGCSRQRPQTKDQACQRTGMHGTSSWSRTTQQSTRAPSLALVLWAIREKTRQNVGQSASMSYESSTVPW